MVGGIPNNNPVKIVVGSRVSSILCNKGNVISIDENIISETIVYIYLDYVGQLPGGFLQLLILLIRKGKFV